MGVKQEEHQSPAAIYNLLPLLAKISTLDMESHFPAFCRHLFIYALERVSEFEIDEHGKLNHASQAIGAGLIESVNSVTAAKYHFEDQREKYLNTWIEAMFKVLLPGYRSDLQRVFKPLLNDLSEEHLQIIKGLGLINLRAKKPLGREEKEIEYIKALSQNSGAGARLVIDAMARMQIDTASSRRVLLIWSAINFPAAALAISSYFEALTFAALCQTKRTVSDAKWPLLAIYLLRRLGLEKNISNIEATLRYGKKFNNSGSMCQRALDLFRESNPADQEIAADAYCDTFIAQLNRLPDEALLNPKLAIGYLSKAAKRAAAKKLPKQKIELLEPSKLVSIYEPLELVEIDEDSERGEEPYHLIPAEIRTLPDFELLKRHKLNKTSYAELGKDHSLTGKRRDISKQAVHKRLKTLERNITEARDSKIQPRSIRSSKRLTNEQWERIKDLIPSIEARSRKGGRRMDNRRIMGLILYKLQTDCAWSMLPQKSTLYERYKQWLKAGVFDQMHKLGILKDFGILKVLQ